jgi:hypothetical protein
MATSKKDASKAGKQLQAKGSTQDQKSVAGSDLAQTKKSGAVGQATPKKAAPPNKASAGGTAAPSKKTPGKKK